MIKIVILLLLFAVPALARDNGSWGDATPSQRKWFQDQKSPQTGVLCCNEADGEKASEDIRDGHYWIQTETTGEDYVQVPDEVVIRGPNLWGRPVAWFTHLNGKPVIRCYVPGAGI